MAKRDIYNRKQRQRRPRQVEQVAGTPLPPNSGVEKAYARELSGLTRSMARATQTTLAELAAGGTASFLLSTQGQMALGSLEQRMAALFEGKAREMAQAMVRGSLKHGAGSLGVSLEKAARAAGKEEAAGQQKTLKELSQTVTLKAGFSPAMKAGLHDFVEENVKLINSIPAKYFDEIRDATVRSITEGQGLKDLIPQVQHIGGVTRERARFIAVDQTRKAHAYISSQKMKDAGITKFRWRHSAGSAVPRPYHKDVLDGEVFELDNPPVIDQRTGERGLPGQLINCRCTMEPVIDVGTGSEAAA